MNGAIVSKAAGQAVLDVAIGFMDVEVSFNLLRHTGAVVDPQYRTQPRPAIVIERGRIAQNAPLFGLKTRDYGDVQAPMGYVSPRGQDEAPTGEGLFTEIVRALQKHYFTAHAEEKKLARIAETSRPKTSARDGAAPDADLTVLQINPKSKSTLDPVIVIRSPEMGLQPNLLRTYLRAILKSFTHVRINGQKLSGLNVSMWGAAGLVDGRLKPGSVSDIAGSLFVGAEVDKDAERAGHGAHFRGVIYFAGVDARDARADAEVAVSEQLYKTAAEAQQRAQILFELAARRGASAGAKIRELVKRSTQAGGTVSLTVSFFGGDSMKEAGRALGLADVNMEDYHILKVCRSMRKGGGKYPPIHAASVRRINCDPAEIPKDVLTTFDRVAQASSMTVSAYVDAIRWGLAGCDVPDTPATGHWKDLVAAIIKDRDNYFIPFDGKHGKGIVLDPFFREIASDLPEFLEKGVAFAEHEKRSISSRTLDDLAKRARFLRSASDAASQTNKITELVEILRDGCGLSKDGGRLAVWVRPGKWLAKPATCRLDRLRFTGPFSPNADKAFYRSSNLVALQQAAAMQVKYEHTETFSRHLRAVIVNGIDV